MEIALFAALVLQVVDFLKELTNLKEQKSAVLTQLCAWGGGVLVVLLGAHAQIAEGVTFPGFGTPLGKLDGSSVVLLGLCVASVASTVVDLKQAFDNNDSAAKPSLLNDAPHA